jgi:DNA polymerase-3 subunit epsilon
MISTRHQSIQTARQKIAQNPVYLDTETTGLGNFAEIIEICILDDSGLVLYESLVKPFRMIPQDVIRIHRITNDLVCNAPRWDTVWLEIEPILADRQVGIYNAEFDMRMMSQSHRMVGMRWSESQRFTPFCIMRLYAQFYGEKNGNYRWHSLDDARRQCGLSLPNLHRARDDSLLARAVLHHMADDSSFNR